MFKKNSKHLQTDMFGMKSSMPEKLMDHAKKTEEYHFYHLIFCNIDEDIFSVLYSDKKSRPNAPINSMVAALILQNRKKWTYYELFKAIRFNMVVRIALGLDDMSTMPFCTATLFNFQNRFSEHFIKTGENLLEQVFDKLTQKQLKALNIKTNIQRTDSTFAASNIRDYTRLQLLVEMIIRVYRVLSDADKKRFKEQFSSYVNKTSSKYIYKLKASDIPHELEKLAEVYWWIDQNLKEAYPQCNIFKIFDRVYHEHFTHTEQAIEVKSAKELRSDFLQSPDDLDATYRNKSGKRSKGQSINVTETVNPDNPVNLLTDISVSPNNKDDGRILNERLDKLKKKTSDLEELHHDAAYSTADNDRKLEQHNITPVQNTMRGNLPAVPIEIEQKGEEEYIVRCPFQEVTARRGRKRFKAEFDLAVCLKCEKRDKCLTNKTKKYRAFHFTHADYLRKKRLKRIREKSDQRHTLRNNVEATIKEFVCRMEGKKLKVRGAFKASVFAYSVGIGVNFGRIYRYIQNNPDMFPFAANYLAYFKEHFLVIKEIMKSLVKNPFLRLNTA